jgi:hypothetical protein
LEFLILSDGDPRNSSIARVGTDKDGELLYMAPWSPLCCIETKTKTQHLLKKGKNIIEEEFEVENWSRFKNNRSKYQLLD